MNETTQMMLESAERLLRDACPKAVVDAAEGGQFPEALWTELEALGLPNACLGEGQGGVGLPLAEGLTLLRLAGRYAVPLPFAETLLGRALLGAEGPKEGLAGLLTIALPSPAGGFDPVPFAPWAQWVLVAREGADGALMLHCVAVKALTFSDARPGLAGDLEARLLAGVPETGGFQSPMAPTLERLRGLLALSRAVMIAGALESALELSVAYALERKQFGREIAKFQAVQQQLAVLTGEVAAALRAADAGLEALDSPREATAWAVAKARAGEAAGKGAEIAHQVHGAMGFTHEHQLHHRTRRLWAWRDQYGHEAYWQARLGRALCAAGADALWPELTATA